MVTEMSGDYAVDWNEPWPPDWMVAGPRRGHNGSQRRVEPSSRYEYHGPTYQMVMHEQTQRGDPLRPHGLPPATNTHSR
jgi:hypothetical protein